MKFQIVISKKDKAGMNIAKHLDGLGVGYNLIDEDSIDADNVDKDFDADFIIFATKHRSARGNKSLTCHAPGNWKGADFGGTDGEVCKTSSMFLKLLFSILGDEAEKQGWKDEVSLECTHHGPLIKKPCCFVEIGSDESGWEDEKAGEIIANVISKTIKEFISNSKEKVKGGQIINLGKSNISEQSSARLPKASEAVIGIGGPHYCPNFNKIQLNSKYAVGHIIPQYVFPVTSEMLQEAVKKTVEPVKSVIIDWKGCGVSSEREQLISLIKSIGLEVLRSDKIEK